MTEEENENNTNGEEEKMTKQKAYKYLKFNNIRMFPSDPTGSLDDFFLRSGL